MPSAYSSALQLLQAQNRITGKAELVFSEDRNIIKIENSGRVYYLDLDQLLNQKTAPVYRS